jgi:hypothetical protein
MIQDVPREKMEQRVSKRVLSEIQACNAMLKERHGTNPLSASVLKAKTEIRYSYEVGLPLGEARLAFAKLPCVEKNKRSQREVSIAYCNNK